MSRVHVVQPEYDAKTIYGAGDEYRFLVIGGLSKGKYFAMEAFVPPEAGPPPHRVSAPTLPPSKASALAV